ncbi:MAG: ribosome-associated toxin RatA of RatAB toxin-antitoxin module [Myxococcota bacterium]|jgi:ribosome-associated toxin RatA of RatAB toxin-antitoxin module
MPSARQSITIQAPPASVMALITDFATYPEFLPEIQTTEILHTEPGAWEVRFTVEVIRRLSYTLRLVQDGPLSLSWTLLEGVFRSNDGGWTLTADSDDATTANYRIDVSLGMFVPGNIVHSLVDRGLPLTLQRFKDEAERRLVS